MQVHGLSKYSGGQGERVEARQYLRGSFSKHTLSRPRSRPWASALVLAVLCAAGVDGLSRPAHAAEANGVQTAAAPGAVQSAPVGTASSKFGPTAVGQKAAQLRADFDKLRANTLTRSQALETIRNQTVANVNSYHTRVGAIRSRLQMGSTPGNPELLAEWSQAQTQLTQIDADIATLNQISTQVSGDAGTSAFILENIRASYGLSGALEEDHRQLRQLEDEVNQNAIVIDRALLSLNGEINRQQQYVASERGALVQLASDINAGQSFAASARRATTPRAVATVTPASFADKRPLVVIRFDKPDVAYEPALYQALSQALQRRPDATFDLVAVAPAAGNPAAARNDADAVFRSMTTMGLPAERIAMAAMSSPAAATPEVHIYVR